jgi:hypothetical protein
MGSIERRLERLENHADMTDARERREVSELIFAETCARMSTEDLRLMDTLLETMPVGADEEATARAFMEETPAVWRRFEEHRREVIEELGLGH